MIVASLHFGKVQPFFKTEEVFLGTVKPFSFEDIIKRLQNTHSKFHGLPKTINISLDINTKRTMYLLLIHLNVAAAGGLR